VVRVTGFDTPFPYTLENIYLPDTRRVLSGIEKTYRW
jgi:2-oxoisovalerate dehydrogenase E1 component beta subunit